MRKDIQESLALFLFTNLALVADAESRLAGLELGRTHHRVLFLVDCQPGVTVGEIYARLRVTSQAIQGALRTLIDDGLIRQDSSERDRRKRHLSTTAQGRKLLAEISEKQYQRIAKAIGSKNSRQHKAFVAMMREIMDESDAEWLFPSK